MHLEKHVLEASLRQCCLGSSLHYSSVVRWKTRSCEYRVPPLLTLVAYFLLPWTAGICGIILDFVPCKRQNMPFDFIIYVISCNNVIYFNLARASKLNPPRFPQILSSYCSYPWDRGNEVASPPLVEPSQPRRYGFSACFRHKGLR